MSHLVLVCGCDSSSREGTVESRCTCPCLTVEVNRTDRSTRAVGPSPPFQRPSSASTKRLPLRQARQLTTTSLLPAVNHTHVSGNMAAAIKALNARIRANPVSDYFCSTRESNNTRRYGARAGRTTAIACDEDEQSTDPMANTALTRRLLGPSLQLRHPNRSSNGHPKRPRNVNPPPHPNPKPTPTTTITPQTNHAPALTPVSQAP